MLQKQKLFSECLPLMVVGMIFFASISACSHQRITRDIDVTSKTKYSGIINGSPMEIDVVATFNTGRGGTSTCKFTKLPPTFNPATLGTHT